LENTSYTNDWLHPQNNELWQGEDGTSNPCPPGWRVPTKNELEAEKDSWDSSDAKGAFSSPLKLTVAGYRKGYSASLSGIGTRGDYWSSTYPDGVSYQLSFDSTDATMLRTQRANGLSVRCIKD